MTNEKITKEQALDTHKWIKDTFTPEQKEAALLFLKKLTEKDGANVCG